MFPVIRHLFVQFIPEFRGVVRIGEVYQFMRDDVIKIPKPPAALPKTPTSTQSTSRPSYSKTSTDSTIILHRQPVLAAPVGLPASTKNPIYHWGRFVAPPAPLTHPHFHPPPAATFLI